MTTVAWIIFAFGVGAMTIARVLAASANPRSRIPVYFWTGHVPGDGSTARSVKLLGELGPALAALGAILLLYRLTPAPLPAIAIIVGGLAPSVLVSVVHNLRVRRQPTTS